VHILLIIYVILYELKVVGVSAINAKALKVEFNNAVDTEKANVEVVKSTIKQNVSKITWAEDSKSVTLELSTKLTEGEYTVNVTGVSEEVLTATFEAENERVESIEILSTEAVVDDTATPTAATVAYQVKNQYGEDITKTTSLTTNDPTKVVPNSTTGVVNLTLASGAKVGDKLPITLIHVDSAKSATQVVTLVAAASVSDVEVTGIYNKDEKTLTEDTVLGTDEFYLLVNVKDQYGNAITTKASAEAGLIKSETNPTVITTAGAGNAVTLTDLTIDGKKQLGLKLNAPGTGLKAGESQVTLISTTTGKSASYKITVAETTRTDVVNLSAPALAVANEDILVPVTVLDKDGNAITDVKVLNDVNKGIDVTFGTTPIASAFVKAEDGNIYIKVPFGNNTTDGVFPLVAQSSTYKVATLTVKVEKAAVPTTIRGLEKPLTLVAGKTANIAHTDLVVEDQYGRAMESTDVATYLTSPKEIRVKDDINSEIVSLTDATIDGNTAAIVKAGTKNGTETLTFVIYDGTKELAASTAEATVRVTDGAEYVSYEVKPVGTVYDEVAANKNDNDAYDKEVEVYGVLPDGSKVKLSFADGDYTVLSTDATLNTDVSTDGVIDVDAAYTTYGDAKEIKLPITVTINATGEKFTQEVTISKVAPKVEKIDIVASGDGAKLIDDENVKALDKITYDTAAPFDKASLTTVADIVVTDQYGVKVDFTDDSFPDGTAFDLDSLTFTKVDGKLVFANNGTDTATVTELPDGSVFNVVFAIGSVEAAPIKVTVDGGYSAIEAADLAVATAAKSAVESGASSGINPPPRKGTGFRPTFVETC
jgi:hypothetical protein